MKKTCQICGKKLNELHLEKIETPNMIFELCLDCAVDVEGKIDDMLKYYKNGDKK